MEQMGWNQSMFFQLTRWPHRRQSLPSPTASRCVRDVPI